MEFWLLYLATGVFAGFLAGLLGVGVPRASIEAWNRYVLALKQIESAPDITGEDIAGSLRSPELRQLFLKTAILLAYADSEYSQKEKAWIEKTAKALGVEGKELARLDELVRTFLLSQLSHLANTDATKEVAKKLGF